MAKATLVGYKAVDFTSPTDGGHVKGTNLYVKYKAGDYVVGEATEKIWLRSDVQIPVGLKPGDEVDVEYNRYGKVEKVLFTKIGKGEGIL